METKESFDRFAIRELLDNWVIWRDSGQWDRLATAFHPEGWMVATWQTAGRCLRGWLSRGLGQSSMELSGKNRSTWTEGSGGRGSLPARSRLAREGDLPAASRKHRGFLSA